MSRMEKLFEKNVNCLINASGVYYIKANECNYVGSSVNVKNRMLEHRNKLKTKKHENSRMQNIFNKYGEEKFSYSILEVCPDIDTKDLLVKEKYWIDLLHPVLNNKLDPVTQTNCAVNSKTVYQFGKDAKLLNSYPSCSEAERITKISSSGISACARGKLLSTGGYLWSYDNRCITKYDLERSKWKWKTVKIINTETGEELRFANIAKAARHMLKPDDNFNSICATISSLCKGRGKFLKKIYKCCYVE